MVFRINEMYVFECEDCNSDYLFDMFFFFCDKYLLKECCKLVLVCVVI